MSDDEDITSKKFNFKETYVAVKRLGKGTYGTVYKVYNKANADGFYAIKKIKIGSDNEGIPPTALREIGILLKMQGHPNVIRVLDVNMSSKSCELLLEFCRYDLRKFISLKRDDLQFYNESLIKNIMYQTLQGVEHLHSSKILHRDLKPQNLMLQFKNANDKEDFSGLTVKVADFGLARVFSIPVRPYTREVLTLWYRAPEMLLGITTYCVNIDVWALGCIFGELYLQQPMFMGDTEIDELFKIMKVFGTFNDSILSGYSKYPFYNANYPKFEPITLKTYMESAPIPISSEGLDLLEKLLTIDPIKRITCKEALKHPYFKDVKLSCSYDS